MSRKLTDEERVDQRIDVLEMLHDAFIGEGVKFHEWQIECLFAHLGLKDEP